MLTPIPRLLHFIWIGSKLPWFAKLAIESALKRVPEARVLLWSSEDLASDPHVRALRANERFSIERLDEKTLFSEAPSWLPVALLADLFRTLRQPAARANVARLLVLLRFGGIYLDTDTVTLRDLAPLYPLGGFCGLEHVVWPLSERGFKPYRVLGGPLREVIRAACALLPRGERLFAPLTPWYHTAANNAVLGFSAGHPFLLAMLQRIAELSPQERQRRYRLGTHLLQEMLEHDDTGVVKLAPAHFYPLGPRISRQYFRARSDVLAASQRLLQPETYLVHWYASVSELTSYDEARVLAERDRTLFAHIACSGLS